MILSLNKSAILVMFLMNCSRTVAFELNLLDLSVYADNINWSAKSLGLVRNHSKRTQLVCCVLALILPSSVHMFSVK